MSRELVWVRASPEREREARARLAENPEESEEQWRTYCETFGITYEEPPKSAPPRSEEEELWEEWSRWL